METLEEICKTLDLLTENEKAMVSLDRHAKNKKSLDTQDPLTEWEQAMSSLDTFSQRETTLLPTDTNVDFEKEALDRAQDSLLAHLSNLKSEYQQNQKFFFKNKFTKEKQNAYEKILLFNALSKRPLLGYLPLFKESNVIIRKRRLSKVLVT